MWNKDPASDRSSLSATLTERFCLCAVQDLAVRAHMLGWEFTYLNDVRVPSELPASYVAFCKQQHRWYAGEIVGMDRGRKSWTASFGQTTTN